MWVVCVSVQQAAAASIHDCDIVKEIKLITNFYLCC